ncbi:actinia tenebrosa protease inhibitors-like [Leptidea sinapis]|uniref:actinia tenebrosa protease inhibitors-like n=1 Tax=Leptidea sinapis TaxID=189913 RepID=UPI00211FF8C9|nr:actinia tenebrosa protease inhibitors-like [Leptidea sinapis]
MLLLLYCTISLFTFVTSVILNTTETNSQGGIVKLQLDRIIECHLQPNGYNCDNKGKFTPVFYYDVLLEDCKTKYVGDCAHQYNSFSSLRACQSNCRDASRKEMKGNLTASVFCRLQPDFGQCNGYHPMFYFDLTLRTCRGFSYSGCGGNINRFPTHQDCVTTCLSKIEY